MKTRFSKVAAVAIAGVAVSAAVFSTGSAGAKQERQNSVVCFNGPIKNTFTSPVFRTEPRKCTFTARKVNQPFDFASVQTIHLRWASWNRRRASGSGKEVINMAPHPVSVRVHLFRAVNRCGHRVFSKARFVDPKTGHSSRLTLHTCLS